MSCEPIQKFLDHVSSFRERECVEGCQESLDGRSYCTAQRLIGIRLNAYRGRHSHETPTTGKRGAI